MNPTSPQNSLNFRDFLIFAKDCAIWIFPIAVANIDSIKNWFLTYTWVNPVILWAIITVTLAIWERYKLWNTVFPANQPNQILPSII